MPTASEFFTNILHKAEQETKVGARTQHEFEVLAAALLPEWQAADPDSYNASRWAHSSGTAAGAAAGMGKASTPWDSLTLKEKAQNLYWRFGGNLRLVRSAIDDLELHASENTALLNEVMFVDQTAFTSLAHEVMEQTTRKLPAGSVFDARTVFDKELSKVFKDPTTGQVLGSRRQGANVYDLGAAWGASQGAIRTQGGAETRYALGRAGIDPADPAQMFREQKALYGQGGFQTKVFVRVAGTDVLEPITPEAMIREDPFGNPFRREMNQDIVSLVTNKRFKEDSMGFAMGRRMEIVEHVFKFLPGVSPEQVFPQTLLGPHRQITLGGGVVYDNDDYTKGTITVHSQGTIGGQAGTWVQIERAAPLEGNARYDVGARKVLVGGWMGPEQVRKLNLPEHVNAQFVSDFSTVSKNPSARWYAEVVSEIGRLGRPWLEKHGYHDAWDESAGAPYWSRLMQKDPDFEYSTVENPGVILKGGMNRFQVLALEINADPARWPDVGERGAVFISKQAGSYTRSGAYSWGKPVSNIEVAGHIARRDPVLYDEMIAQSTPRQAKYAEVMNATFLNAGVSGVTSTDVYRNKAGEMVSGTVDLTLHPEIAAEIMASATAAAAGGEIGYNHIADAIERTLKHHGYGPAARMKFSALVDGVEREQFLVNAPTGKYLSGPHWRKDITALLQPDEVEGLDEMQKIVSRFARTQVSILDTLGRGMRVSEGQTNRLLNSGSDLIGSKHFNRALTGLTVTHSISGPIVGDDGVPPGQMAVPDEALHEMFTELHGHPERLNKLRRLIDTKDVVGTWVHEPSPSINQQFFNLRLITHDSIKSKTKIQATNRMIINPVTMAQGTGDFDGDGFSSRMRSRIHWDDKLEDFVLDDTYRPITSVELVAQRNLLESRTLGKPDALGRQVGMVGAQGAAYLKDVATMAAVGGDMQLYNRREIMGIGQQGSASLLQLLGGQGWMRQSKEGLGYSYNLGRQWRGLSNDDDRFADLQAALDEVYVKNGRESRGLRRYMEDMRGYQPGTNTIRRGGPGQQPKYQHVSSPAQATFDMISNFMQIEELGNDQFVAELLLPDDSDPDVDARRATLVEIRKGAQWSRLKEVFGDDPWEDAAFLSPIIQAFRAKSTGRWSRRLSKESQEPGNTPVREMSETDQNWAEMEEALSSLVNAESGTLGGASRNPDLTARENAMVTGQSVANQYRNAAGDTYVAAYLAEHVAPLIGLVGGQTHVAGEMIASLKAQASLLSGARVHAATGGGFMVPPGYENDDFLIAVKSGEHVTVVTAAQQAERDFQRRLRGRDLGAAHAHFLMGTPLHKRRGSGTAGDVRASGLGQDYVSVMLGRFETGNVGGMTGGTSDSARGIAAHTLLENMAAADTTGRMLYPEVELAGVMRGVDVQDPLTGKTKPTDLRVTGKTDLMQLYQDPAGQWRFQLFDYKTGRAMPHDQQLALYKWMVENGQIMPGADRDILDAAGKVTGTAPGYGQKLIDDMAAMNLSFQAGVAGKQQVLFGGANVIERDQTTTGASLDAAGLAANMFPKIADPANQRGSLSIDEPELRRKVGEQYAVNKWVGIPGVPGGHIGMAKAFKENEVDKLRFAGASAIHDDLESPNFSERLRGMQNMLHEAGLSPFGGTTRHTRASGGGAAARSPFNTGYRNPGADINMEVGRTAANRAGDELMSFAQGRGMSMERIIGDSGDSGDFNFRPEMERSRMLLQEGLMGRGGRRSWGEVALAASNMQGFTQANQPNFSRTFDPSTGATMSPFDFYKPPDASGRNAGPGYGAWGAMAQAIGGQRGQNALALNAASEYTTDIHDIARDASAPVQALVPIFDKLTASGRHLDDALIKLRASTTDVGKSMTESQTAYEKSGRNTLRRVEEAQAVIRKVVEGREMPAEGSETAGILNQTRRAVPALIDQANQAAGGVGGGGGFMNRMRMLFGQGGDGGPGPDGGGAVSRLERGQQLLTGVQMIYMARLDRLLVEPALQAVNVQATGDRARGSILASLGMGYTPTTAQKTEGAYLASQNLAATNSAMTWGPFLQGVAKVGNPLAGVGSIIGPAAGLGAMGAYVAGQLPKVVGGSMIDGALVGALPVAAPAAITAGIGLAAAATGIALLSRQQSMVADPAMAAMVAYNAQPSAKRGGLPGFIEFATRAGGVAMQGLENAATGLWNGQGANWEAQKAALDYQQGAGWDASQALGAQMVGQLQGGLTLQKLKTMDPTWRQPIMNAWMNGTRGAAAVPATAGTAASVSYPWGPNGPQQKRAAVPGTPGSPEVPEVIGALAKYGLTPEVTQAGFDLSMRSGLSMDSAMAATAAQIPVDQTAVGLQGYYGGTLEAATARAAAFANVADPLARSKLMAGIGTPLAQALNIAGKPMITPQNAALMDPQLQQQATTVVQTAYGAQQYNIRTGRDQSDVDQAMQLADSATALGIGTPAAQSMLKQAAQINTRISQKLSGHAQRVKQLTDQGMDVNTAEDQATSEERTFGGDFSTGAGLQHLQTGGQVVQAQQGLQNLLMSRGQMTGGAAFAASMGAQATFGGNLGSGQGAQFMQAFGGYMGGNANVVSQISAAQGAGTSFTTAAGVNISGAQMVTMGQGGVTGFAGMGIGQSSVLMRPGTGGTPLMLGGQQSGLFANPALASIAQQSLTTNGRANNAMLGTYTPMGVTGGWMAKDVGGQTWGTNIGGLAGLQMQASDISYQGQMASAGLSLANIRREEMYTTGIGLGAKVNPLTGKPLDWSITGAVGQPFQEGQGTWAIQDASTRIQRAAAGSSFGYQMAGISLQGQQFAQNQALQASQFAENQAFGRTQSQLQFTRQTQDFGIQRRVMTQQRQWQTQDIAYDVSNENRSFGWQMQDIDLNLRYATGRDRIQLEKEKTRAVTTHDVTLTHEDVIAARQKLQWKNEDERYAIDVKRAAEDFKIRGQQFDLEKKHFEESAALAKSQNAAQLALSAGAAAAQYQFTLEQQAVDDKARQLERASWADNIAAQKTAVGIQAGVATLLKKNNDDQANLNLAMSANLAQIGQWYDTEYGMMNTWIGHMKQIEQMLITGKLGDIAKGSPPGISGPGHTGGGAPEGTNASGTSRMIYSPTLLSLAEMGPEHVTVTPFGRPGFGYAATPASRASTAEFGSQGDVYVFIGNEQVVARVERGITKNLTGARRR